MNEYPQLALHVAGEWIRGGGRESLVVRNPATGDVLEQVPVASPDDVSAAIAAANSAFRAWSRRSALERGRILARAGQLIRERAPQLARTLTLEAGKTLSESHGEIVGAADTFEWMAEEGKRVYGRVVPSRLADTEQMVIHQPLGVVAAFTPWNSPLVLAARKIATSLAAGCTIVLKGPEETPGICVRLVELCIEAGVPPAAVNLLFGNPDATSRQLIASRDVHKLTFTGSVPVGKHLLRLAADHFKQITLELGGHSPVFVDRGVDVALVARLATAARFRNAGQACHGPTRFFVHEAVYGDFAKAFAREAGSLRVGNGLEAGTQMGPLIHKRRADSMMCFVEDARVQGARILTGGSAPKPAASDCFWQPTLIGDANDDVAAMREEVFGPIALLTPWSDLDEALRRANSVDFGLGSYAFTNSLDVAHRIQEGVEAGNLSINTFAITAPEVPFGGIKQSGAGVEMGIEGLAEMLRIKTIVRAARPV